MSNETDIQEQRGADWMADNPRCARCGHRHPDAGPCTERHTPGPWHTTDDNRWSEVLAWKDASNQHLVAACATDGADRRECQANARLIAAAPDLLAACKATLWAIENAEPLPYAALQEAIDDAEGR